MERKDEKRIEKGDCFALLAMTRRIIF